ncbi:MAG: LacI family DNA-binding transcriptional regulator [Oscillospiraceae bacterium]|nr:LacI family DNA-binding transcriptional regulator [Oscillospiraceae bacterium]
MARKRVTMQDIAAACGLSRNTVSKIFNSRGAVPESTRKMVLQKAQELGYNQIIADEPEENTAKNIALLTQHKLLSHNFGAFFITSFTDQISRAGYTLKMYEISPGEIRAKSLPPHFALDDTYGILGIELFDRDYVEMICSLGKPTVFVDGYAHINEAVKNCDFISMENTASVFALVDRLISAGARSVGFVGDIEHCNSFYERWIGCRVALGRAGIIIDRAQCILDPDGECYGDVEWLEGRLSAMDKMPDAFVCANDYLAIHLMAALKKLGCQVPQEKMVTGFDGSMESAMVEPALTTAQIPSTDIGRLAADTLSARIVSPGRPYTTVYVRCSPIFRQSTR